MILTLLMLSARSAVGDSYKNILNSFEDKSDIICIIPSSYTNNEFSSMFYKKIVEKVSTSNHRLIGSIKFAFFLKRIIKENKIKKVFIYSETHWFNSILYIVLFDLNLEYAFLIHDPKLHLGERIKNKIIRYINSIVFIRKVSTLIVTYQDAVYELVTDYKINKKNIHVIYLPRMPEMEFHEIKNSQFVCEYDFIFWGRIEEYKGLDLLIDAIQNYKNIKLLIIGNGKEAEKIKKLTKNALNITFINKYVENKELATYIMRSKWVVLPYKTATGTQTIQIANYYGKPVLVRPVGCFKDYVKEETNGLFIKKYTRESFCEAIDFAMSLDIVQMQPKIEEYFLCEFSMKKVIEKLAKLIK